MIIGVLVGSVVIGVTVYAMHRLEHLSLFKRFVMNPIPASVTDLEVDGKNFISFRYILKFEVSRSDLDLILATKPFRRLYNVVCKQGQLSFNYSNSTSVAYQYITDLSRYSGRGTLWHALESWSLEEAYFYHEEEGGAPNARILSGEPNDQILIYNAETEQAYFIVISDN